MLKGTDTILLNFLIWQIDNQNFNILQRIDLAFYQLVD